MSRSLPYLAAATADCLVRTSEVPDTSPRREIAGPINCEIKCTAAHAKFPLFQKKGSGFLPTFFFLSSPIFLSFHNLTRSSLFWAFGAILHISLWRRLLFLSFLHL